MSSRLYLGVYDCLPRCCYDFWSLLDWNWFIRAMSCFGLRYSGGSVVCWGGSLTSISLSYLGQKPGRTTQLLLDRIDVTLPFNFAAFILQVLSEVTYMPVFHKHVGPTVLYKNFFFRLIPSGLTTADFPSPFWSYHLHPPPSLQPPPSSYLCRHVLSNRIHEPPSRPSPFPLSWLFHPQHPSPKIIIFSPYMSKPRQSCNIWSTRPNWKPHTISSITRCLFVVLV